MTKKNRKSIFVVTVASGDPQPSIANHPTFRSINWGFYFTYKSAKYAIEHNVSDISEQGYYQYAILQKIGEGIMAFPEEMQWYEFIWNRDVPPRKHDGSLCSPWPLFVEAKKIDKPEMYGGMFFNL
jgi:hypothetical protein